MKKVNDEILRGMYQRLQAENPELSLDEILPFEGSIWGTPKNYNMYTHKPVS